MANELDLSIESIEIDEELDDISKFSEGGFVKLPYPAVTICNAGNECLYFNTCAASYFNRKKYDGIRFSISTTYVVMEPCKYKYGDGSSFKVFWNNRGNNNNFKVSLPAALKERGITRGIYKLYKCKEKFVFKRYEPINFDEEDAG